MVAFSLSILHYLNIKRLRGICRIMTSQPICGGNSATSLIIGISGIIAYIYAFLKQERIYGKHTAAQYKLVSTLITSFCYGYLFLLNTIICLFYNYQYNVYVPFLLSISGSGSRSGLCFKMNIFWIILK